MDTKLKYQFLAFCGKSNLEVKNFTVVEYTLKRTRLVKKIHSSSIIKQKYCTKPFKSARFGA